MESPEVSTWAICSQTLDASAKDTSPADISTATLSPGDCVYSSPGPSFSTNSRSVSTIASMVVSPSSDLSSTESTEISGFSPLDLDEPAPLTRVLNVSTSDDLSISVYNTEESPADVLNDAMMETQTYASSSTSRIWKCPTCSGGIPESVFIFMLSIVHLHLHIHLQLPHLTQSERMTVCPRYRSSPYLTDLPCSTSLRFSFYPVKRYPSSPSFSRRERLTWRSLFSSLGFLLR